MCSNWVLRPRFLILDCRSVQALLTVRACGRYCPFSDASLRPRSDCFKVAMSATR